MAKWCSQFNCWCSEAKEIIEYIPHCEFDCNGCDHVMDIKPTSTCDFECHACELDEK